VIGETLAGTRIPGYWWLPHQPEARIAGEAVVGPSGRVILNLFDSLIVTLPVAPFTMLGETRGFGTQRLITLLNCTPNLAAIADRVGSYSVSSPFVLIGRHFDSIESLRFRKVMAELPMLPDWVQRSGRQSIGGPHRRGWAVQMRQLPPIRLGEVAGLAVSLRHEREASSKANEFTLCDSWLLDMKSSRLEPYFKYCFVFQAVSMILSLASMTPVAPRRMFARHGLRSPRFRGRESRLLDRELEILLEHEEDDEARTRAARHDLVFHLADIGPDPASFLRAVIEGQGRIAPSLQLLLGTVARPSRILEQDFLFLAQALEAFHRRVLGGTYLPPKAYEERVVPSLKAAVPNSLAPEFRTHLLQGFAFLNEYSLRKRLRELHRLFADHLTPLLGSAKSFADHVTNLRNELTHPGSEPRSAAERTEDEVFLCSEQMRLLLVALVLREFGFGPAKAASLVSNPQHNTWLKWRLRQGEQCNG
jgi:hypothetical protein